MWIESWEHLVDQVAEVGIYTVTAPFGKVARHIRKAVAATVHPAGSTKFTIYPESGKKTNMGNGVKPIKKGFTDKLVELGWTLEKKPPRSDDDDAKGSRPGAFDCHYDFEDDELKPFVVEWETGNISSSHRAINRIGLGIKKGYISGGALIVPTVPLATYLTDRVGNKRELLPYYDLWRTWDQLASTAYFGIIAVEHDAESLDVPRIPKGTDGRAAR
ncbi:hypothetical protein HNP40_000756 [Mycobacteroides chelonae]|nr:hypothetical protein [Mycobacteroides chelonae]